VDELTGIMIHNTELLLEKDIKLSDMERISADLQHGAQQYQHTASGLNHHYWYKNYRLIIILALILVIILALIWMYYG